MMLQSSTSLLILIALCNIYAVSGRTTATAPKPISKLVIPAGHTSELRCPNSQKLSIVSAVYSEPTTGVNSGDQARCPDANETEGSRSKCNTANSCSLTARDPSQGQQCASRSLTVRYTCSGAAWAVDPDTEGTGKPGRENVLNTEFIE